MPIPGRTSNTCSAPATKRRACTPDAPLALGAPRFRGGLAGRRPEQLAVLRAPQHRALAVLLESRLVAVLLRHRSIVTLNFQLPTPNFQLPTSNFQTPSSKLPNAE